MNILHMKYAVEIAKAGSINKASENLLIAQPNLSRSLKELESDLGIVIFERSPYGMTLTPDGENFIGYAKKILSQIAAVESIYKDGNPGKRSFSVSVPRSSYISDAFANFSQCIGHDPVELFYKETNSSRTIKNVESSEFNLGIVRYAENHSKYFEAVFEEKELTATLVTQFNYVLIMSNNNPLAKKSNIRYSDLAPFIEIAHADPFVPSLSLAQVKKEELPDNTDRRIFVFERASQFELLARNHETFMWMSPVPDSLLSRYELVQKKCSDNIKVYRDVLIHRSNYKLTELDKRFVSELKKAIRECFAH